MRVLINFRHGIGDAVQLSIVLKHIQKHRPDWIVDVESLVGKHTLFDGLCNQSFVADTPRGEYDKVYNVRWYESFHNLHYNNVPLTKVTKSLRDEFGIEPDPALYQYQIAIRPESIQRAVDYTNSLPKRKGLIIAHFQGNTGSRDKNIEEHQMREITDFLNQNDFTVIILDWDKRAASRLPNIFCPDANHPLWDSTGTGDGNILAALIEQANLFIGIDSGPLHIAGALKIPSIGLWTKHHPLNFFDLSNTLHLLPVQDYKNDYFNNNYKFNYYSDIIESTLIEITKILNLNKRVKYERAMPRQWWRLNGELTNINYL